MAEDGINNIEEYNEFVKLVEDRSETIGPILPGASWVSLAGNFTSNELRIIADQIDYRFAKVIGSGNKK